MAHFERSLFQELDFKQEVINSERCRDFFQGYDGLYLPKVHVLMSSKRSIVMEFVKGDRIDDL
jgi:predicted unusual protein kinase regulating ubiquinone biosynthesis (AarF/ABC1/UbiB family)